MPKSRIALAIFVAILAVSTASIFIRLAQKDAPSLVIAAVRLALASLILLPAAFHSSANRAQLKSLSRADWTLAILSGLFLSVHFASWITSLEYTTVVASVVLVSTGPLWVAVLSPLFLREFPSRWVWNGMFLALVGTIIVGLGDSCAILLSGGSGATAVEGLSCPPLSDLLAGSAFLGNFLALVGAWTVAGYLMIGRRLRARMDLVPYVFVVYSVAALALIVYMLVAGQSPFGYQPLTYVWLLALALVPQLIGHSTYNWALRYLPASLVSVTTLGEPIGSAILALLILGEIPPALTLVGGAFILGGIYLSTKTDSGMGSG
ncbi:MAG: DMT family transporter [Chloroflexota bacterium]